MLKKPLLLAIILFFTGAAATTAGKPVVRVTKLGENFRFELCEKDACETLGRENGYSRLELENWKKFRESTASEIAPMITLVAAVSLIVAGVTLFPLAAIVTAGAVVLGSFAYFFSQAPQVQARMPNDVYHEFQADPELLPALKKFLLEIDQGIPVADQNPRVLSGDVPKKSDTAPETEKSKPDSAVIHAR